MSATPPGAKSSLVSSVVTENEYRRWADGTSRVGPAEAGPPGGFTRQKHLLLNIGEFTRRRVPAGWGGALHGLPAFVCGGGPSLETSVAALARQADQGVVIADDSAMALLARHDVPVDFLLSSEAHQRPERCLPEGFKPGRVVLSSVSPPGWREAIAPDRFFFLSSGEITENWLENLGVVCTAIGVSEGGGRTGIELAHFLGCAPIYFFGIDLAADPVPPAGGPPRVPENGEPKSSAFLLPDWQALDARLAGWPADLANHVNDRGARLRNTTRVHPAQFDCAATSVNKRAAVSHLAPPDMVDRDAVRAGLAALGAQGALGCRRLAELREVLARTGTAELAASLHTMFAPGDFACAMGAFAFTLRPQVAASVIEDPVFWSARLDELEELCCLAESVYDLSLA